MDNENDINFIISLTTIPSKFDTIHVTIDSLLKQTHQAQKIIINIPKTYNFRFAGSIDKEKINKLIDRYEDSVIINLIDTDYGPGTKLLGLFSSNLINQFQNTYIVLVDDDVIYKPYMLEHFNNYIKDAKGVEVASYCTYTWTDIKIGQGVDGFFMKQNLLDKFQNYYNVIKDEHYVNYHDDFYISYYFYLIKKDIHFICPPYNSGIYEPTASVEIDALQNLEGIYCRGILNRKVIEILNNLNYDLKFKNI